MILQLAMQLLIILLDWATEQLQRTGLNSNFLIDERNLDVQSVAHLTASHNQFRHLVRVVHMIKLHLVFVYTYLHTYRIQHHAGYYT